MFSLTLALHFQWKRLCRVDATATFCIERQHRIVYLPSFFVFFFFLFSFHCFLKHKFECTTVWSCSWILGNSVQLCFTWKWVNICFLCDWNSLKNTSFRGRSNLFCRAVESVRSSASLFPSEDGPLNKSSPSLLKLYSAQFFCSHSLLVGIKVTGEMAIFNYYFINLRNLMQSLPPSKPPSPHTK